MCVCVGGCVASSKRSQTGIKSYFNSLHSLRLRRSLDASRPLWGIRIDDVPKVVLKKKKKKKIAAALLGIVLIVCDAMMQTVFVFCFVVVVFWGFFFFFLVFLSRATGH